MVITIPTDHDGFAERESSHPAHIDEKQNEAYSSAITISHIEGDADIEEILMFRLELDVLPKMDDSQIFLEIDMIFHEGDHYLPIPREVHI